MDKKLKNFNQKGISDLNHKEFNTFLETKDKISEVKKEIDNIKSNKEEINYLLNTGELVFQYYENINKIALGENINYDAEKLKCCKNINTTNSKKKNVIDFFSAKNQEPLEENSRQDLVNDKIEQNNNEATNSCIQDIDNDSEKNYQENNGFFDEEPKFS